MKSHLLARCALISLFAVTATTHTTASANTYINLSPADSAVYLNGHGQMTDLTLTPSNAAGWTQYSEFLGAGERFVWTSASSEAVYLFNDSRSVAEKLVNFADPVGTNYSFNLGTCTKGGKLAQKGLSMNTAVGTFNNVMRMTFTNTCADGGTLEAWFAPQVGVIKWSNQTLLGPVNQELAGGKMGGKMFGITALQSAMKLTPSFSASRVVMNGTAKQATANIQVANNGTQDMVLHFASGQEFEISLIDSANQVVNTWGARVRFLQGAHDVVIGAGKSQGFGGVLALQNLNGNALAAGQYTLRVELKSSTVASNGVSMPTAVRFDSLMTLVR
jgi:hypothetical protein